MEVTTDDDDLLRQFLLGELPEAEHARLQEACFLDATLQGRVLAAADDLIDAYVRGELTEEECVRFEERFASTPEQRQRLDFARQLARATDRR
ncbi:MAG TPA: zf-HC2 domain-containing protein [Thermoanaerobaculia bacterium]